MRPKRIARAPIIHRGKMNADTANSRSTGLNAVLLAHSGSSGVSMACRVTVTGPPYSTHRGNSYSYTESCFAGIFTCFASIVSRTRPNHQLTLQLMVDKEGIFQLFVISDFRL